MAASLEAFVGYCLGCKIFALLMRTGVIPESVCEECNDIWGRSPAGRLAGEPVHGTNLVPPTGIEPVLRP